MHFLRLFCSGLLLVLFLQQKGAAQETAVDSACVAFMKGRVEMYQSGDLSTIQKVGTAEIDTLYSIFNQEMQMLFSEGYSNRSFVQSNLLESVVSVEVSKDSATCKMRGLSIREINLVQQNGQWLVHGENGESVTSALIKQRQEKLIKRQQENENILLSKPVLAQVEQFKSAFTPMLAQKDFSKLEGLCSEEVIEFMQLFVDYALSQETLDELQAKRKAYKSWVAYTTFSADSVECSFNKASNRVIHLVKTEDNDWQIVGFNHFTGEALNQENLENHYASFMRVFGFYRRGE